MSISNDVNIVIIIVKALVIRNGYFISNIRKYEWVNQCHLADELNSEGSIQVEPFATVTLL